MSNYSTNNKTISDEISKKDTRSNKDNKIIIPLGLLIREATQRILPYPPPSYHDSSNMACFDVPALSLDIFPIPVSLVS